MQMKWNSKHFLWREMVILRGVEHMCLPVTHETFIAGEIKEL